MLIDLCCAQIQLVRSIHIGHMLNTDAVSASLKDGVLEVQIPKHTSSERRTITIDSE
ncbi:MAG: Hsp20/alpha crystallin family protein [Pseudomonadota bacterium]|nr:Hsp20/alpha crystallin family protein [Pseudomonadota bacterium]